MIHGPDGRPFLTYVELARGRDAAQPQWAEAEQQLVQVDRQRTEAGRRRDAERERAERLSARLRELGIDPEE